MKSLLLSLLLALGAAVPATAAEPVPGGDPDRITFEQYRDWRIDFIAKRQTEISQQLAASGVSAADRDRLQREKAYYDRQATMPAAERDRMFHARFDRIDANHDGVIDRTERTAWHDQQSARYRREAAATGR